MLSALLKTRNLARAMGNDRLADIAELAARALSSAPGSSERERIEHLWLFDRSTISAAESSEVDKILTTLADFAHGFGADSAKRAVLQDWERIMALAARNDRLVRDVETWSQDQAEDEAKAVTSLIDAYVGSFRDRVMQERARFEELVDSALEDNRLKAADQITMVRQITNAPPRRLGSKEKRRQELMTWRAKLKDREAIFSPDIR